MRGHLVVGVDEVVEEEKVRPPLTIPAVLEVHRLRREEGRLLTKAVSCRKVGQGKHVHGRYPTTRQQ